MVQTYVGIPVISGSACFPLTCLIVSLGTGLRDKIFLASKFGFSADWTTILGNPDFIAQELATSLRRLQTDHIDLYYVHRTDPKVPIETTMEALAGYVK